EIERTVYEERTVGALSFGLGYLDDHSIDINSYVLKNDEDDASISRGFDNNVQFPDQRVTYATRLEKRELELTQISGSHAFRDTPMLTSFLEKRGWDGLEVDWFYSDSTATTDIPNETLFQAQSLLDSVTGAEVSTQLLATTNAG